MILRKATLIDGLTLEAQPGCDVLVEDGVVREVGARAIASSSAEVLHLGGRASATSVAARILGMEGKLGIVALGAFADLIVVEGNPLEDVALLATGIRAVMLAGAFVERPLF